MIKRRAIGILVLSGALSGGIIGWFQIARMNPLPFLTRVGNWYTTEGVASPDSSAALRSFITYNATFALPNSEVIYFTRRRDDDGELLREDCDYEISGNKLPAHWWSVTIYDEEGHYAENNFSHSIDESKAIAPWTISISPDKTSNPLWISNKNAGEFNFVLRLYLPQGEIRSMENLPVIKKVACRN